MVEFHHGNIYHHIKSIAVPEGHQHCPGDFPVKRGEVHEEVDKKDRPRRRPRLSSIIHELTNGIFVGGAIFYLSEVNPKIEASGVSGPSNFILFPGTIISLPLIMGMSFAFLERLVANIPIIQPIVALIRDVNLIIPKIFEDVYNQLLIGPPLRVLGIDAPLNVTSTLRFGEDGTKQLIRGGTPNLITFK